MNGTGIGEVRTKLLDTDHKQWNCGMGVFDTNVVFYKEDPNGYVIIDGKRCKLLDAPQYVYEKIGDKVYKTVKIGNLQWMCENLDYKWDGLLISSESFADPCVHDPAAAYREDDESTWGWNGRKCGLYYNSWSWEIMDEKLQGTGWRLPTIDELDELYMYVSDPDETVRIDKLFVPDCIWSPYGHPANAKMNETGLSLIPAGLWDDDENSWSDLSSLHIATIVTNVTNKDTIRGYVFEAPSTSSYGHITSYTYYPCTVRLVKDV